MHAVLASLLWRLWAQRLLEARLGELMEHWYLYGDDGLADLRQRSAEERRTGTGQLDATLQRSRT